MLLQLGMMLMKMVAFSKIVIAGGGIIGNSVSYYLAKLNIAKNIIDTSIVYSILH